MKISWLLLVSSHQVCNQYTNNSQLNLVDHYPRVSSYDSEAAAAAATKDSTSLDGKSLVRGWFTYWDMKVSPEPRLVLAATEPLSARALKW